MTILHPLEDSASHMHEILRGLTFRAWCYHNLTQFLLQRATFNRKCSTSDEESGGSATCWLATIWRRSRFAFPSSTGEHGPLELVSDETVAYELKAMATCTADLHNCCAALREWPLLRKRPGPTKNLDPPENTSKTVHPLRTITIRLAKDAKD